MDSTTITLTPSTFEDVPIENQGMDLSIDNVLNPNDVFNVGAMEDVVENVVDQEVEIIEKSVAFNELRQYTRDKRPSAQFPSNNYVFLTDGGEPESFEVLEDENKKKWMDSIEDEMKSLCENNTFELGRFPKVMRALKKRRVIGLSKMSVLLKEDTRLAWW